MTISIKGIKNENNEWKPQEGIFFTEEIVNQIITDEQLKTDMTCVQGVGFDYSTQTFTNVVVDCSYYNNEFIFLIKTDGKVVRNQSYVWAYVVNKSFDTRQKVVLDLVIDTLSTNWENFNTTYLAGEAYVERATNFEREYNNIHSETCSSISNVQEMIINNSQIPLNNKIDIFYNSKVQPNRTKSLRDTSASDSITVTFQDKGELITSTDNPSKFIAYKSTVTFEDSIEDADLTDIRNNTIVSLLKKYTLGSKYEDDIWDFRNATDRENFLYALTTNGSSKYLRQLVALDKTISDEALNTWLSIPKFFNGVNENQISDFEIDLSLALTIIMADIKSHSFLHKNYYISCTEFLKIPLDFLNVDMENRKIYGTRIISMDGVIFKFYYRSKKIIPFYQTTLSINNGLLDSSYNNYERDLNIAYNSGLKGPEAFADNLVQQIASGALGFVAGKGFGIFNLISNTAQLPFNLYKDYKDEQYQRQLILSKPRQSRTTLLYEALNNILLQNSYNYHFMWINVAGSLSQLSGYTIYNYTTLERPEKKYFNILIEQPIQEDIDKIDVDQQRNGNVMNQYYATNANVLKDNNKYPDHIYFKGKIMPANNPIDNFQLDILNETLAKGVYIKKVK